MGAEKRSVAAAINAAIKEDWPMEALRSQIDVDWNQSESLHSDSIMIKGKSYIQNLSLSGSHKPSRRPSLATAIFFGPLKMVLSGKSAYFGAMRRVRMASKSHKADLDISEFIQFIH